MSNKKYIFAIIGIVVVAILATTTYFVFMGHRTEPQIPSNHPTEKDSTEFTIEDYNKLCVADENLEIEDFITRTGAMTKAKEGFWYRIVEEGDGKKIEKGDIVTAAYAIELLDGKRCYSSDVNGLKKYRVGQREVEKGLDMATPLFTVGTEAEIVIPSFMAHGVAGDRNMIPGRTPILYKIKFIDAR